MAWFLFVFLYALGPAIQSQSCPSKPDLGEKVRRYTGHYQNRAYGFATNLPRGMVGIDSDDPNYQRGFVIVLSNGAGTISVWAEVNSADEFSLHSAAASSLAELRKRADHVFSPIYVTQQIGGRRAEGVSVKFVCKGSEVQYGFQSVGTVDRSGRFVYSLIWEGPQSGVLVAKRTMGALERSWRFIPAQ